MTWPTAFCAGVAVDRRHYSFVRETIPITVLLPSCRGLMERDGVKETIVQPTDCRD